MRRVKLIEIADRIAYLLGESNYTTLYFIDGSKLLIAKTIRLCGEELPTFIRIHKRYVVNPACLNALRMANDKSIEVLAGTAWLRISRRRFKTVFSQLPLELRTFYTENYY